MANCQNGLWDQVFEESFWKPYFRGKKVFKGSKVKALTAWRLRTGNGTDPEAITRGLGRALAYHKAVASVEEDQTMWRFMPYAERFLSPEKRYWERDWALPKKIRDVLEDEEFGPLKLDIDP